MADTTTVFVLGAAFTGAIMALGTHLRKGMPTGLSDMQKSLGYEYWDEPIQSSARTGKERNSEVYDDRGMAFSGNTSAESYKKAYVNRMIDQIERELEQLEEFYYADSERAAKSRIEYYA